MNKQTAVEWFAQQLGITSGTMLDQAKEMEREQIIDAYDTNRDINTIQTAEHYYNETYKGGEQ